MNKRSINGVELCYRDLGSGPPIIFLHAFPLSQKMWDAQVDRIAANHRVITFDWRGFGQSSLGAGIQSVETFADDLAALMKSLNLERATICGLSMGGYAAFAFYRKYRDLLSSLILADTRATPDTEEGKRGRQEMADLVRTQGTPPIIETMIPRLIGETTLQKSPAVAEQVRSIIKSGQPEGIAQALIAMANRPDSTSILAEIDCPTLIISGDEDRLIPLSEAEKMHHAIPKSSFEIVHQAGHLPNLEQPEGFNLAILKFLSNLSAEGLD
ncbi:MAG TPA: alpha/beta fold hydrolase [Blastocatellia bacterium]|nr:alpha/beta fold hydrolase [Blastocatellia bacterium]